jgi:hypothetical protein
MSIAKYPTIGMAVPTYSYLLDIIDEFLEDNNKSDKIKHATKRAKDKLQVYYPTADGLVYVIGTSIVLLSIFY